MIADIEAKKVNMVITKDLSRLGRGIIDARLWVLVPNIVETNFRRGGGWDVETKWFGRLPEWDWSEKGVEPVAQAMSLEDSEDTVLMSSPSPTEQAASLEAVGESTPTSNTNSTEPRPRRS